jgi:hypothetical protein
MTHVHDATTAQCKLSAVAACAPSATWAVAFAARNRCEVDAFACRRSSAMEPELPL